MLTWIVDFLDRVLQRRVDVELRIHRASFLAHDETSGGLTGPMVSLGDAYLLNLLNRSPQKEVTVTHVWIASEPPVAALVKTLPAAIKPGAQWETWIMVDDLPPDTENVERLGRARLGDDRELKSIPRENVPWTGYIPG